MPALISFTLKVIMHLLSCPLTTAEVGLWARLGIALIDLLTLYGLLGVSFLGSSVLLLAIIASVAYCTMYHCSKAL